jgi:hypothetical protein
VSRSRRYTRVVTFCRQVLAVFLIAVPTTLSVTAQKPKPIARLLRQFDTEHGLAEKEVLLGTVVRENPGGGPALLQLAESTRNTDTRWMAMRGMVRLHCAACAPFLAASLKDPDVFVRANAARALGDLKVTSASGLLLEMFTVEQGPPAIEQASLALHLLDIKAGAPAIREKIPRFPGQTRAWLVQALGALGDDGDVPLIAGYLEDEATEEIAVEAIERLTGVYFGFTPHNGLSFYPPPELLLARAWWKTHKDEWPRCQDCRHH